MLNQNPLKPRMFRKVQQLKRDNNNYRLIKTILNFYFKGIISCLISCEINLAIVVWVENGYFRLKY